MGLLYWCSICAVDIRAMDIRMNIGVYKNTTHACTVPNFPQSVAVTYPNYKLSVLTKTMYWEII